MKEINFFEKFLKISMSVADTDENNFYFLKRNCEELLKLYQYRNGCFAFMRALVLYPTVDTEDFIDLSSWNALKLWDDYDLDEIANYIFFGQDIFGNQFCIYQNAFYQFDLETGKSEYIADDFQKFIYILMQDYKFWTGYPIAHMWQEENGKLPNNQVLMPKIPFCLGGKYELDNLYATDILSAIQIKLNIYHQLKDLPPGSEVQIQLVD